MKNTDPKESPYQQICKSGMQDVWQSLLWTVVESARYFPDPSPQHRLKQIIIIIIPIQGFDILDTDGWSGGYFHARPNLGTRVQTRTDRSNRTVVDYSHRDLSETKEMLYKAISDSLENRKIMNSIKYQSIELWMGSVYTRKHP